MMNYIWSIMMIAAIIYGAFTGQMEAVTNAAVESSKEAITLCITMLGVMGFWMGLMEIAQNAGVIDGLSKKLQPFISFMFPNIPLTHPSRAFISTNVIANVLGLGWAATPAGLEAMESLANLEEERRQGKVFCKGKPRKEGEANNEMCTFLILNISSLQLIPMTIIAYRSEYGSANPSAVIVPCILATIVSTGAGILYSKWKER